MRMLSGDEFFKALRRALIRKDADGITPSSSPATLGRFVRGMFRRTVEYFLKNNPGFRDIRNAGVTLVALKASVEDRIEMALDIPWECISNELNFDDYEEQQIIMAAITSYY